MADHPQAFDEFLAGSPAALDSEADDRARAARQQSFCQLIVGVSLERGVQYPVDGFVGAEVFEQSVSVCHMAIHANAERLDALQQLKSVGRRKTGAEVAQAFGARPHDERGLAELLVEDN